MPVDSQMQEDYDAQISEYCNGLKSETHRVSESGDSEIKSEDFDDFKDNFILTDSKVETTNNIVNGNNQKVYEDCLVSVRPKTFSDSNSTHHFYAQPLKPNKWGRMAGFLVSGNELKSSLFSRKLQSSKQRLAQAKKSLNHLYSYFSVTILDCEKNSEIVIGLSRKDFPRTSEIGKNLGSVAYYGGSGEILCRNEEAIRSLEFSKGDTVGCGILFPPHYRRYADLSTDDSSDGMTDVVLTSLLNINKKSMDFVQNVLRLKRSNSDSSSSEEEVFVETEKQQNADYFNENYVESRKRVEIYFTLNMQIVGKISTCVPIGGFYPTVQVSMPGDVRLQFEFS